MKISKRTFAALDYAKGSKMRKILNKSAVTSEYMTSYKYAVTGDNLSITHRTKGESQAFVDQAKKNA